MIRTVKGTRTGDTWQRILDCAETLFAKQGYNGTSTRQIAHEVGISIQTLHYHCAGKKNLHKTVMERSIVPVTDLINAHVQGMLRRDLNDPKVLEESVSRLVDELFDILHSHPNYALLFYRQWLVSDPDLRSVEWERLMPVIRQWSTGIEAQLDKERLSGMNLFLFFISLSWMYWGLFLQPDFISNYLQIDQDTKAYLTCLKDHAREMTLRMMEQRKASRASRFQREKVRAKKKSGSTKSSDKVK